MDFISAKTILTLFTPPAFLIIAIGAGFLMLLFCRLFGKILIVSGFLLLYLLSLSPVAELLLKPLETNAAERLRKDTRADAIVVLSGGVKDLSWLELPPEPSSTSLERVVKGVTVYRVLQLPLVLAGGNAEPDGKAGPEADAMARVARDLGVPSKNIIAENKSRNTIESARALKGLLKGRRIVLITSAFHLKRATAMFRKQGFTVTPISASYLYQQRSLSFNSFIPEASSLSASSTAISEYIKLFWYSVTGDM